MSICLQLLLLGFLTLSLLASAQAGPLSPLSTWSNFNTGISYIFNPKTSSSSDAAQRACENAGGSLLSITSMQDVSSSIYSAAMQANPTGALFWIGLRINVAPNGPMTKSNPYADAVYSWSDRSSTAFIQKQTDNMIFLPGCRKATTGNTTCCGAMYNVPSEAYLGAFPPIMFHPCPMMLPSICALPPSSDASQAGGVASLGNGKKVPSPPHSKLPPKLSPPSPPKKKSPPPKKKTPPPPPFAFIRG